MTLLSLIKGNKLVLPLAFIAVLTILAINELSYFYTSRYTEESKSILRSQALIRETHSQFLNAERSQLIFLLSRQKRYLLEYQSSIAPVSESLSKLKILFQYQSGSLAQVMELERVVMSKLDDMNRATQDRIDNPLQTNTAYTFDDRAEPLTQRTELLISALTTSEADRYALAQENMHHAVRLSRLGIASLSVLYLLATLIYLRKTLKSALEQFELRRTLASERDQLEHVVFKRTQELTQLARYLQSHREDERSRLARDLHDDLGALLTSAKLAASRIKSRLDPSSLVLLEILESLVGNINASIKLGRKIIEDLRPSSLNNLGLVPTLIIFSREFSDSSSLIVHNSFDEVTLPVDSQLMVYRLMQEACTNILKHAKASNVWLKLGREDGMIVASVRDDGVGFETDRKIGSSYGLLGMRYRVEAAQGVLNIISKPGEGTLVQALL